MSSSLQIWPRRSQQPEPAPPLLSHSFSTSSSFFIISPARRSVPSPSQTAACNSTASTPSSSSSQIRLQQEPPDLQPPANPAETPGSSPTLLPCVRPPSAARAEPLLFFFLLDPCSAATLLSSSFSQPPVQAPVAPHDLQHRPAVSLSSPVRPDRNPLPSHSPDPDLAVSSPPRSGHRRPCCEPRSQRRSSCRLQPATSILSCATDHPHSFCTALGLHLRLAIVATTAVVSLWRPRPTLRRPPATQNIPEHSRFSIRAVDLTKDGVVRRFLVRWVDRPTSDCTWIPAEILQQLDPDLLEFYQSLHDTSSPESSSSHPEGVGVDTSRAGRYGRVYGRRTREAQLLADQRGPTVRI